MKELKNLPVGAHLYNNQQNGYIILDFRPWDGGPFGLHPRQAPESLVFVDPNRPAGYGIEVKGDPDALDQVAAALKKLARDLRQASAPAAPVE